MRRLGLIIAGLLLAVLLFLPGEASAQCAMCATSLQSPEARAWAAALRRGILVLLSVPFVTFATVACLAIRSQRRLDDEVAPEAPGGPLDGPAGGE